MNIKIHRGTHQIGGCVTEYECNGWHLFVDYGEELPGGPKTGDLQVEGMTHGDLSKSALLITHYHGDHIGSIIKLPKELPIYMGKVGRDIQRVLSNHLKNKIEAHKVMLERLEHVNTFREGNVFKFGPFSIMPVTVDHSAFDAYAFKIVADGVSVYHTGDFRLHGFRSGKIPDMLQKYVGKVDYVVCEGTNVARPKAASKEEYRLQKDFETLFKDNKGCVVYMSSTNIDRLFALYQAAQKARRAFYVDEYQKEVMDTVVNSGSIWTKSKLYQYGKHEPKSLIYDKYDKNSFFVSDSFKDALSEYGYVLIARANPRFDKLIEQIPGEKKRVLSMWNGYVKEGSNAYNENLARSLDEDFDYMHTSGHIDMSDLREFLRLLHPNGIIPIHTEKPEAFAREFSDEWPVIVLNDGDCISPISSSKADTCKAEVICIDKPKDDTKVISHDGDSTYWRLCARCLGDFKNMEDARSILSHTVFRPHALLGYEIYEEEDSAPMMVNVYDSNFDLLATYKEGGHKPGGKKYQEECRFKVGEKVLAAFQAGYKAVVPATVVGPVVPDIIRKNFESDEMASNYYDSFEDFQETLIDWDWDSVAVHPHVRLNSLSLTMSDTELVPRVMLFPLLNFKCE
ncbi:MBL fold metallo-hydrolase [Prevotella communis]|jgi:ribonuclease J|uniref:MBL fold metallo-hydrolase n=1 Tax=Prevotella communis TaxID=2913614 RepID=UPI001EDA1C29|nr:MBL fold metallo-hydrolase [Prevotella communis]UKK63397.1 MBL fold metallo-hydrolase [Prevotella communis]UKK66223.1 MBL fold metallo-hydrolase [Prevotella communis]